VRERERERKRCVCVCVGANIELLLYLLDCCFIHRFSGPAVNNGGRPSSVAVQNWSMYFDGSSYLEIPLSVSSETLPRVTIGAWVKPASLDDTLPVARYAQL
jgi:hypothetical protein